MSVINSSLVGDYARAIAQFQAASSGAYPGPSMPMEMLRTLISSIEGINPQDLVTSTEAAVGDQGRGVSGNARGAEDIGGLKGFLLGTALSFADGAFQEHIRGVQEDHEEQTHSTQELRKSAQECSTAIGDVVDVSDSALTELLSASIPLINLLSMVLSKHPLGKIMVPLISSIGADLIEKTNETIASTCRDRDAAIEACYEEFESRCDDLSQRPLPQCPPQPECGKEPEPPGKPDCPEEPADPPAPKPKPEDCPPEQTPPEHCPPTHTSVTPPLAPPGDPIPPQTDKQDCPPPKTVPAQAPPPAPPAPEPYPVPEPEPDPCPLPQPPSEPEPPAPPIPEPCPPQVEVEKSCCGSLGVAGAGIALIGLGLLAAAAAECLPPEVPEPEPVPCPEPEPAPCPEPEPEPCPEPEPPAAEDGVIDPPPDLAEVPEPLPPPEKLAHMQAAAVEPAMETESAPATASTTAADIDGVPAPVEPEPAGAETETNEDVQRVRKAGQW